MRSACPKSSKVAFDRTLSSGEVLRDGNTGFSMYYTNRAVFIKPAILALMLTDMTHIYVFRNCPNRVIFVNR